MVEASLWHPVALSGAVQQTPLAVQLLKRDVVLWRAEDFNRDLAATVEMTMKKQSLIEKTNGLVYAVVMESRGLYIADEKARIEQAGPDAVKAGAAQHGRADHAKQQSLLATLRHFGSGGRCGVGHRGPGG